MADVFVILDSVEMPNSRSLLNRAPILLNGKSVWLTLPIHRPAGPRKNRCDVEIVTEFDWTRKHRQSIFHNYRRAPHLQIILDALDGADITTEKNLFNFNLKLISTFCDLFGIRWLPISLSDLNIHHLDPSERIIDLCKLFSATQYISGTGAKNYLNESMFLDHGISIYYSDYQDAPYYQGSTLPFIPGLSIIDRLCWQGIDSTRSVINDK